jgi:wyosine [tRNA(Phe)-imidazoG37] synthetase (radical SAM superfamily)
MRRETAGLKGAKSVRYVFGPVPSRRLGRSLGVDLVPFKTCTYDCIYCQLGRTSVKTIDRKEWVPLEDVLKELRARLASKPDCITLSGSGEPTLSLRLGELINHIQAMTDVPVAVLTNGSLLWREDVRRDVRNADVVIPSLDAGDAAVFRAVNRPHEQISYDRMLSGLADFRQEFEGQYWLEVFLLDGYTAMEGELAKLARCADRMRPDRIHLNTVTRPPAEGFAVGVSHERMVDMAGLFRPPAEVISDSGVSRGYEEFSSSQEELLSLLQRRPCSIEDIAEGLGMHRSEVLKLLEGLTSLKALDRASVNGKLFYRQRST